MNYAAHQSEMRQSDEIMKKLNQIKNAIDSGRIQSSPNNLNDYLPNQRLNSNSYNDRVENKSNPLSYRRSLEKKLQRLFKQQKKGFNQNQIQPRFQNQQSVRFQSFIGIRNKDAFTLEKMEIKIKQLQRKYLHSNTNYEENPCPAKSQKKKKTHCEDNLNIDPKNNNRFKQQTGTPSKKTKSIYQKKKIKDLKKIDQQRSFQKIQQKSDKSLLKQIEDLKSQVKDIKNSNVELNEKIFHKEHQRKHKKQRSKYLLKCILYKLIEIQQEVSRRDLKQLKFRKQAPIVQEERNFVQERQTLKNQNFNLMKQVNELNKQLKFQINQKQIAQERSKWIQDEIRKINKGR